ncbi:MAG: YggS family pyridoxal phosphate-dependent enzyme [Thermoguttaceae bacterium]|nr:YggS family pyridoxal phosphate-dependent enzyme [Thermoguttaceae bacterium]
MNETFSDSETQQSVYQERLAAVMDRIAVAAQRSGRANTEVTLVIVSKYLDIPSTEQLIRAGIAWYSQSETPSIPLVLGESRPQLLSEKASALSAYAERVAWHQIGPLQTNKMRRVLPWITRLHSGESLSRLVELNREAERIAKRLPVLLEVNISGESAKYGFSPDELPFMLDTLATLSSLQIDGLMGMASLNATESDVHRQFASLRQLAERLRPNLPDSIQMRHLSMGMSGDFEIAIEEGATLVRVGSAIAPPMP